MNGFACIRHTYRVEEMNDTTGMPFFCCCCCWFWLLIDAAHCLYWVIHYEPASISSMKYNIGFFAWLKLRFKFDMAGQYMLEMHFVLSDILVPILVYWQLGPHPFLFPRNRLTQNPMRLQFLRLTFQPLMKVCFFCFWCMNILFWGKLKAKKRHSKCFWSLFICSLVALVGCFKELWINHIGDNCPESFTSIWSITTLSDLDIWTYPVWWDELEFFLFLADLGKSRYISQTSQDDERPDLGNARIVITGGRALKSAENFKLIENLATKLGAAGIIYYICYYGSYFYV